MDAAIVDRILHEHGEMRARLADWEGALQQLGSPGFAEWQRGLERLWRLVPFFEREVARHFREEEAELYPQVESDPAGRPARLGQFAAEHAEFSRQWQAYKRELLYCDAVGETRRVIELGTGMVELLRRHMQTEEAELLPRLARH